MSATPSSSALDWFATRPLTFDELVVCRVSDDEETGLVLLSTPAGLDDARARRARPAAHGPRGWELGCGRGGGGSDDEGAGTPLIVSSRLAVASALAASLSGDASSQPELDPATWRHWSQRRLSKAALFRLLLPFHADTRSFLSALDAATSLGLVSRKDVRDCGGPNALWGVLIDEMNEIASRDGKRFALDGLDLDDVDAVVEADADRSESRAARIGSRSEFRAVRSRAMAPVVRGPAWLEGRRGGLPPPGKGSGGGCEGEGGGPAVFFDAAASAAAAAERVARRLALKGCRDAAGTTAAAAAAAAAPKPQQQQQQQQLPPSPPRLPRSSLKRRLSRLSGSVLEGAAEEGSFSFPLAAPLDAAADVDSASVAATASRAAASLAAASSVANHAAAAAAVVAAAAAKGDHPLPASNNRSSSHNNNNINNGSKDAAPASFCTPAEPEAGVLEADDAPERERVPLPRLAQFLAGVAALSPGFLAAAYVCLLASVVAQLLVPLAFAMGFQALATGDGRGLALAAAQAAGLAAAAVGFKLVGGILLECFARKALRKTYAGLFDHLLFQEASFLERLAPGELMVRASGGSATLRSLVTTVAFSATEGALLFLGAVVFLLTSSTGLAAGGGAERMLVAVALAVALAAAEALVAGQFLWRQNLAVRRALGAVLGFSTDALSSPAAILSLERGPARAAADARLFLRDYASAARTQGIARAAHASLASAITAALRLALLWQGARALFHGSAALSDVYALFAITNWMEAGLLLFADAYATAMADVGSLERLVELHDRGAFDPLKKAGGSSSSLPSALPSSPSSLGPPTRFDLDGMGNRATSAQRLTGGFSLRGVKVARPGGNSQLLLRGATTARISSGRALLVSGAPLAGKSSLVDVLCLRLMPFKGGVEFEVGDEKKERGETGNSSFVAFDWLAGDKRAVRRALGVVGLNSAALFPTTLAENVAIASSESSSSSAEEVKASLAFKEACAAAGVDELAAALPRGMETVLSSSAGLPAGAALRVALARAMLREPALLLVDDADAVAAALGEAGGGGGGGLEGSRGEGRLNSSSGAKRLGAALSQVLARGGAVVLVGSASVVRARSLGLEASLCESLELRDGVLIAAR